MNASAELSNDEVLKIRLEMLRLQHRELDARIGELEAMVRCDALELRRLKRQKLALKDQAARLEDRLIPDIIA